MLSASQLLPSWIPVSMGRTFLIVSYLRKQVSRCEGQAEYCECVSEKEVNVRFAGSVYRNGKFWLAVIPILDVMTQGYARKEAFEMMADLVETLAHKHGFSVIVDPGKSGTFEVSS